MQKISLTRLSLWALAAGSILLTVPACKKSNHDSPPAPATKTYRALQERDSIWGTNNPLIGVNYATVSLSDYQYDDKGNLISLKSSSSTTYSDGKSAEASASSGSQFDDRGFLLSSLYQKVDIDRSGQSTSSNISYNYQYDQDRLKRESLVSDNATTDIKTYQWDAAGNLTDSRDTLNGNDNGSIHYDYLNGMLFKVTASGTFGSYSPFVEVNAQGLFIKTIDQGNERRYQYDAEGELTRVEYWTDGVATSATVFEYDHNKNINLLQGSFHKGFPSLNYVSRTNTLPAHNYSKISYFGWDGSGQWTLKTYTVYSYTYNSSGYPVTSQVGWFDGSGVKLPIGGRSTYTYTSF